MMLQSAVMRKHEAGFWQQQRNWAVQRIWVNGGYWGQVEPGFAWAVCILAGAASRMYK